MAHRPRQEIENAYRAWWPGVEELYKEYYRPALRQGWESGYVLGDDHGFTRGWEAATDYWEQRHPIRARLFALTDWLAELGAKLPGSDASH